MTITLCVLLVITMFGISSALRCEDDGDCKKNMYCFTATHNCVQCVECSEYKRHDKGFCVKEPLQCGDCLPGYEPEILSDGVRSLCVLSSSPLPQTSTSAQAAWEPWLVYVLCCAIMMAAACALLAFIKWKDILQVKYRSRYFPDIESTNSSSSVLYAPSAPTQPPSNGGTGVLQVCEMEREKMIQNYGKQNEKEISGFLCEKHNENLQRASVFLSPSYVTNSPDDEQPPLLNNGNNNNGGGPDSVDGPGPMMPSVPSQDFLNDEDTLPSSWTPGLEYPSSTQTNNVPLVTSFSGILLNEASSSSGARSGAQNASANHSANGSSRESVNQINVTNITVINGGNSNTAGVYNITQT